MSHRVQRFLHVLACAPVAALLAVTLTPSMHARAAAVTGAPYVVALDAGHGGPPDNLHPDQLFDPGTVGPNGLLEKDVTLDMARRVQRLLEQDGVKVVMTRTTDVYLDIGPRMQTALDAGAQLFISIHMNGFQDPNVNGSVVLYPGEASRAFADIMESALSRGLAPYGVTADGTMLRDNLWVHATMPAATLEPLYLTNAHEADLMSREDVRGALAAAIRDGIEKQAPEIQTRHRALAASSPAAPIVVPSVVNPISRPPALPASPAAPPPATTATTTASQGLWSVRRAVVLLVSLLLLAVLRRPLARLAGRGLRPALESMADVDVLSRHLPGARHRMRAERRRRLLERSRSTAFRHAIYDELWF